MLLGPPALLLASLQALLVALSWGQHQQDERRQFPQPFQGASSSFKRNLRRRLSKPAAELPDALASARLQWRALEQAASANLASLAQSRRHQLDEILANSRQNQAGAPVSGHCSRSLHDFLDALGNGRRHATEAFDASTKQIPVGLLSGTLADLGNFDQCTKLSGFQYCSLQVKPSLPSARVPAHTTFCKRLPNLSLQPDNSSLASLSLNSQHFYFSAVRLSLCLPLGCSRRELQSLLINFTQRKLDLFIHLKSCQVAPQDPVHLDTVQQCILWLFGAIASLVLVATTKDLYRLFKAPPEPLATDLEDNSHATSSAGLKSWHYQVYQANQHLLACSNSPRVQLNPLVGIAAQQAAAAPPSFGLQRQLLTKESSKDKPDRSFGDYLSCFSLVTNLQALIRKPRSSTIDTQFLHGFRSLTMAWVIFAQSCSLASPEMTSNFFVYAELLCTSRLLQALLNVTLAATTFYVIAGLTTISEIARKCPSLRPTLFKAIGVAPDATLAAHVSEFISCSSPGSTVSSIAAAQSTQMVSSKRRNLYSGSQQSSSRHRSAWPHDFTPLRWLLGRYIRLTPSHLAALALAILLPALGSGPFWPETMNPQGHICRQQWISNLLYSNNLHLWTQWDQTCLPNSWYLSNEFQFFGVALLLLALLYLKMAKIAGMFAFILGLACTAATFAMTSQQDLPPAPPATLPATLIDQSTHSLYHEPWPYLPCYLIGLLTGFLLIVRDRLGSLGFSTRILVWILVSLLSVALLNCLYPWNLGLSVEPILTGFHGATFRSLWAVCCSWLLFALASRPKCLVSRLLAWHGFCIPSRLTYCVFLVHSLVINYHLGSIRDRLDSTVIGLIYRFVANLLLSYFAATILVLMVEHPFIRVQQLFIKIQCSNQMIPSDSDQNRKPSTMNRSNMCSIASRIKSKLKPNEEPPRREISEQEEGTIEAQIPKAPPPPPPASCLEHPGLGPKTNRLLMDERAALDAEFQRKLAQAIGRGFRIRSKMANSDGTTRVSVNRSVHKKWLAPQQAVRSKLEFSTFIAAANGSPSAK